MVKAVLLLCFAYPLAGPIPPERGASAYRVAVYQRDEYKHELNVTREELEDMTMDRNRWAAAAVATVFLSGLIVLLALCIAGREK